MTDARRRCNYRLPADWQKRPGAENHALLEPVLEHRRELHARILQVDEAEQLEGQEIRRLNDGGDAR